MSKPSDLVQGTLDLLILTTVAAAPSHGWAIAKRIRQLERRRPAGDAGLLYPALHRLEQQGWLKASWIADRDRARGQGLRAHGCRPLSARERARELAPALDRDRARRPTHLTLETATKRWLDILRLRVRSLLRCAAAHRDLTRELRFHLDERRSPSWCLTGMEARRRSPHRHPGVRRAPEHRAAMPRDAPRRRGRQLRAGPALCLPDPAL